MTNIPTYNPATQDLLEEISTNEDGEEVHKFTVKEKPEWRQKAYEREVFNEGLPEVVDDMNTGIVEVANMADENTTTIEDINMALIELAALIDKQT